jgi:hypothetical protein
MFQVSGFSERTPLPWRVLFRAQMELGGVSLRCGAVRLTPLTPRTPLLFAILKATDAMSFSRVGRPSVKNEYVWCRRDACLP